MGELLFSYGTLQKKEVQLKLFGRPLNGTVDSLKGFRLDTIKITDVFFLLKGEEKNQFTVINTGSETDSIEGTVLELNREELILADKYEPVNYKRVGVVLNSGKKAWIYMATKTIVLQAEHKVQNFESWKKVFDSDPIGREKSGVKAYRIYRPTDNPGYVIVELEFETAENANKVLAALRKVWGNVQGSVIFEPIARIMELEEERKY